MNMFENEELGEHMCFHPNGLGHICHCTLLADEDHTFEALVAADAAADRMMT